MGGPRGALGVAGGYEPSPAASLSPAARVAVWASPAYTVSVVCGLPCRSIFDTSTGERPSANAHPASECRQVVGADLLLAVGDEARPLGGALHGAQDVPPVRLLAARRLEHRRVRLDPVDADRSASRAVGAQLLRERGEEPDGRGRRLGLRTGDGDRRPRRSRCRSTGVRAPRRRGRRRRSRRPRPACSRPSSGRGAARPRRRSGSAARSAACRTGARSAPSSRTGLRATAEVDHAVPEGGGERGHRRSDRAPPACFSLRCRSISLRTSCTVTSAAFIRPERRQHMDAEPHLVGVDGRLGCGRRAGRARGR